MSDKVFFLRFKDHCATLNMLVTLAVTERSGASQELYQPGRGWGGEGLGERQLLAHLSRSLPSKPTNKLQCTFDTN